jgi:hypothetical protein
MLLRLRVTLPDRPGALGRVTRVLGALGADILSVTVLDREAGRVVDEFTVSWPGYPGRHRVVTAFDGVASAILDGVWPAVEPPDAFPDLDVLGHVAAEPDRAVAVLVDAIPGIFSVDWAAVVGPPEPGTVRYGSSRAPDPPELPDLTPSRSVQWASADGTHLVAAPVGATGLTLVLGRTEGPSFHRVELLRLSRLLDITLAIAGDRLDESSAGVRAATGEART